MATYERLSYSSDDGCIVNSSSEPIGFYGKVPVTQPTISSAISTTASISTSGVYGFASSTETLQVVGAVSTMAFALKSLGLVV